jgi:hypothetical protein
MSRQDVHFSLLKAGKNWLKKGGNFTFKRDIGIRVGAENVSRSARLGEILSCADAVQRFY